jgi:hypothetical protein
VTAIRRSLLRRFGLISARLSVVGGDDRDRRPFPLAAAAACPLNLSA